MGGQLAPKVADEIAFNPRNRWRFIQDLITKCWRRLMKEYLSTLNTRNKLVVCVWIPATYEGIGLWVEFKKFFLALTGRSELYALEQEAKIMCDRSRSCVPYMKRMGGTEHSPVRGGGCSGERLINITLSVGTAEHHCMLIFVCISNRISYRRNRCVE